MFCSKCGAEAIEGSRFCRRCGAPLEEQAGKAIEKGIQRGAAQRLPGRPRKPLLRLPTSRKAAIVSGLVIALIGAALGGYIGLGGRLPGLAGDSGGTLIALPDGASIHIPSKAVDGKPKVVARVVAPEDMPSLPDWADGAPALYEFTVDRPLRGAAELRIPLPRDTDLALLSHYHDGSWKPVPFRIEGKMAVAEVTQLSLFGFLAVGYDKLERWLQGHPLINWALGGGTQAAGSPCEREAPGVTVRVDGTPRAVSACAQSGIGGTEVVVRNDRRFYLDVYPARGDLQWATGGLPWSCCDGRILPPEGRAVWLWRAPDGEAVLEVRFTVQAAAWTIARLLVAPIGAWAWSDPASGELLQMLQEVARWVPTVDATINIFAQLMSDRPDYAVVGRELARFFSNPDALAAVLEQQLQQGVLTRAGIYATSAALRKLLVLPTVANQMRTAADLVAAALGGGVAALVTATPTPTPTPRPSPTPTPRPSPTPTPRPSLTPTPRRSPTPTPAPFMTRVSVASDGTQGNDDSRCPSISADGRYVAFESEASNLVPGDTNGRGDIFVHDRVTGQTTRVSVASDGTQGNDDSEFPSISADGRYVAFESEASNLVPGDTNDSWDVFVAVRE
jgi:hypothetical protein